MTNVRHGAKREAKASGPRGRAELQRLRVALMIPIVIALFLGLQAEASRAQGLDAAALLKPATDTCPTYNGDYSGRLYSTLDQINAGNVSSLALAWVFNVHT